MSEPNPEWRDDLRDWWDDETTVGVESSFPIVARLLAAAWEHGAQYGARGLLPERTRVERNPYLNPEVSR